MREPVVPPDGCKRQHLSAPPNAGWVFLPPQAERGEGLSLAYRNPGEVDILDHRPDNGQATGFCGERINLIRALPHIATQTFNRIGPANRPMPHRWKRGKGQPMLFVFTKAADGF